MKPQAVAHQRLAAILMSITLLAVVASLALIVAMVRMGAATDSYAQPLSSLSLGASYATVGWLVAFRRSENRLGWVFLAIGIASVVQPFTGLSSLHGLVIVPGSVPLADVLSWVATWSWVPAFALLATFSLLLFPDGRLPSPRWRVIAARSRMPL